MNLPVSIYILIGLMSWLLAQSTKYLLSTTKKKDWADSSRLYLSGGMPSAHSATTVSMLTAIAINEGLDSSVFAVMAILTAIVLYDAMMVRRSSGEQGEAIIALLKEQKSTVKKPFVAKGHSLAEVAVGSVLGFLVAIVVLSI